MPAQPAHELRDRRQRRVRLYVRRWGDRLVACTKTMPYTCGSRQSLRQHLVAFKIAALALHVLQRAITPLLDDICALADLCASPYTCLWGACFGPWLFGKVRTAHAPCTQLPADQLVLLSALNKEVSGKRRAASPAGAARTPALELGKVAVRVPSVRSSRQAFGCGSVAYSGTL